MLSIDTIESMIHMFFEIDLDRETCLNMKGPRTFCRGTPEYADLTAASSARLMN